MWWKFVSNHLKVQMYSFYADIGSNEIHVTPLQYSVTFWALLMVFKYICDTALMYLINYFLTIVFVFVIEYSLQ